MSQHLLTAEEEHKLILKSQGRLFTGKRLEKENERYKKALEVEIEVEED